MKPVITQQEILFFTGTSFAQAELKSNDPKENASGSKTDRLENAFWNGMLFEMLPELKIENTNEEKMFMWRIGTYRASMSINLGNVPGPVDLNLSIDPYLFIDDNLNN